LIYTIYICKFSICFPFEALETLFVSTKADILFNDFKERYANYAA